MGPYHRLMPFIISLTRVTLVSSSHAPVLSFAHFFQATHAIHNWCAGTTYSRTSLYGHLSITDSFQCSDEILIYFL